MKKFTLRLLVLLTPFVTGLLLGFLVGNCSGRHHALRSSATATMLERSWSSTRRRNIVSTSRYDKNVARCGIQVIEDNVRNFKRNFLNL